MSTQSVFNNMLKVHQPFQAMEDETKKSNYVLSKMKIDKSVKEEQNVIIPWELAEHSNVRVGSLTASNEITRGVFDKGEIQAGDYFESWGSIKIDEKDIRKFSSAKEAFMTLFPQRVRALTERFKEQISISLLTGGVLAKIQAGGTPASGIIQVSRPERFAINQRIDIKDDDTAVVSVYVREIDMNNNLLTCYDAMTGGAVVDLSAYTAAQNAAIYMYDGSAPNYDSLKSMLFPASAGGDSELHHVSKTASPILQAHFQDASGWSSSTILDNLLDFHKDIKQKGKVKETELTVPYKVMYDAAKKAEASRRFNTGDQKFGYGFESMRIMGQGTSMKLTGIYDLDTEGYAVDWSKLMLFSPNFFTTSRELGNEPWYMERNESGYVYILDILCTVALCCKRASGMGAIDFSGY